MWTWLKKLFSGAAAEETRRLPDTYKPTERVIYNYWDGEKMIRADPMVLFKAIMAAGADLWIDIKVSMSEMKDAPKAFDNAVKKIRGIFNVKSLTDGGLTEAETLNLFDSFLVYVEELKKNSKTFPTLPTATSVPLGNSTGASPPTPNTSDSGSTDNVPLTVAPSMSPSEPASPSAA